MEQFPLADRVLDLEDTKPDVSNSSGILVEMKRRFYSQKVKKKQPKMTEEKRPKEG